MGICQRTCYVQRAFDNIDQTWQTIQDVFDNLRDREYFVQLLRTTATLNGSVKITSHFGIHVA
jgi:hypothetical protein